MAIRNSVWISLSACKEESKTDIKKTAWQQYSTQSTTYQTKRDKSCTYCIISATFFSPFTYKHTHTDERKHLNQIKLDFVMINKQFRPKWAYLSYSLLFYMEITPICLMAKLYPNFKKKCHHQKHTTPHHLAQWIMIPKSFRRKIPSPGNQDHHSPFFEDTKKP